MAETRQSETETRALEYIRREIPELESHLTATRDFALEINRDQSLGLDEGKVAVAALCHDLARLIPPDQIVRELKLRGIDTDSIGFAAPILFHGFLSAELAKDRLGVSDPEILHAIRWHATGKRGMNALDKLIYVADKIDETRDWPGIEKLREAVRRNFSEGFPKVIAGVIQYVVDGNLPLDYNSVEAYNEAVEQIIYRGGHKG